jgi:hypothetical protein
MFSKEDFNKENAERLSVIIMTQMDKPPLTPFPQLTTSQRTKFNRLLNEYIQNYLQTDDWQDKLLYDFNLIITEDVLNEEFDASKQKFVPIINTDRELLLNENQVTEG